MNKKFETLKAGLGTGIIGSDIECEDLLFTLESVSKWGRGVWCCINIEDTDIAPRSRCIPHLFPLSHLAKPIRVEGYNDGKEFIPITHLFSADAYLHYPVLDHSIFDGYVDDIWLKSKMGEVLDMSMGKREWKLLNQWHFNTEGLDESDYIDASVSKVYEPK